MINGRNLRSQNSDGSTWSEQFPTDSKTLLVFLRHFGCTFCRQTVALLKEFEPELKRRGVDKIVFVFHGALDDAHEFFEERWPSVTAIHDPDLLYYRKFGVIRGTPRQLLGPRALIAGIKGLLSGHGIGRPKSDPFLMPGFFLLNGDVILKEFRPSHAGEMPTIEQLS